MDSLVVSKEIKKSIVPILKDNGFQTFTARNAWRHGDNKIDVINFLSFNSYRAAVFGCTTFSFVITLGVYFKFIPSQFKYMPEYELKVRSNMICPETPYCHVRKQLQKTIKQDEYAGNDVWFVDPNGKNLDDVITNAASVINSDSFSWFSRFENLEETLRMMRFDEEYKFADHYGRIDSPIRNYQIGYMALKLGDYDLAETSLKKAIDCGLFGSERLKSDYELALSKSTLTYHQSNALGYSLPLWILI
jgi:hypothetical protein